MKKQQFFRTDLSTQQIDSNDELIDNVAFLMENESINTVESAQNYLMEKEYIDTVINSIKC